jgi:hypothetical protein
MKSDYTVLVVSKNSLDSDWVYVEFMEMRTNTWKRRNSAPVHRQRSFDKSYQMKLVNDRWRGNAVLKHPEIKENLSVNNFEKEEKKNQGTPDQSG